MTDTPALPTLHAGSFTVAARTDAGQATLFRCVCSCSAFDETGPDVHALDKTWYTHLTDMRRAAAWTEQQLADARPVEEATPRQPSPTSGRWMEHDVHGEPTGGLLYPAEMAAYLEHGSDGVRFTAVGADRVDLWDDDEAAGHYKLLS